MRLCSSASQFHCTPKSENFETYYTFLDFSSRERNLAKEFENLLLHTQKFGRVMGCLGTKVITECSQIRFANPNTQI